MKKIFIIILMLSAGYTVSFAQGKFSANISNTGNFITFKVRPDLTTTTGFSGIEFFLRYPTSSPAFTYGSVTANLVDFPNMAGGLPIPAGGGTAGSGAWEIIHNDPNVTAVPGFNIDHFLYTAPAAATTAKAYTGGTSYDVITVQLLGSPTDQVDFQFISDDSYGTGYLGLTDQNGGDLLPASPSNYFYPTTLTTPLGGSTIYYMDLLNVPVPVKFLGFNVTKSNNTAVINWSVENEDANTATYEILLSTNGVNFDRVLSTVSPANNGRSSNSYSFTQQNITSVLNSGVLYYKIKQTDRDGRFVFTEIKSIRLSGKSFLANVFPNPVKDFTTITLDLVANTDVTILVSDAAGKQVQTIQMQGFKGLNTKAIDMSKYASGSYLLKVQAGTEVKTLPIVKTN